jgi:hypothetical protein
MCGDDGNRPAGEFDREPLQLAGQLRINRARRRH